MQDKLGHRQVIFYSAFMKITDEQNNHKNKGLEKYTSCKIQKSTDGLSTSALVLFYRKVQQN